MSKTVTATDLDALLPQTQCGLCGYGGCMPYATALIEEQAAINLCPPGGVPTLTALAQTLAVDPTPFLAEMTAKAKPPTTVFIQEAACIGCTKCIQVCPVDAIVGAAKLMHTVLQAECTGCDLCIPACPMDCIDIISTTNSTTIDAKTQGQYRTRFQAHNQRLAQEQLAKAQRLQAKNRGKLSNYVNAAIARAQAKKKKVETS